MNGNQFVAARKNAPWEMSKEEWQRMYREKVEVMEEELYPEVSPLEFYRDLFPEGSLQKKGVLSDGKGNIIAAQLRDSAARKLLHERTKTWIVTEDDFDLIKTRIVGDYFGLIPPLTFFGKSHGKDYAHWVFALVVDIDYVGVWHLRNLLKQCGNGVQLRPTYIVNSGKGVHIYYFLKEPQPLYRNIEKALSDLKKGFIRRLWVDTITLKPDEPDIAGITQAFRAVGSQSKLGKDYPVRAYRISDNRYTLDEMQAFLAQWAIKIDISCVNTKPWEKTSSLAAVKKKEKPKKLGKKLSLEEAKKLYPEWYQERIIERRPRKRTKDYKQGTWVCKTALYEWWKGRMKEAKVGGRYFTIMALCSFGLKCGIPIRQIREDAYSYREYFDSLTKDESNHFTAGDIEDALRALSKKNRYISTKASREWIETHTKIPIPANKRNGRKLEQHLKLARAIKAVKKEMGEDVVGGRPSAEQVVEMWQHKHPTGRKADCIRETGLSKPTVYKWWDPNFFENIKALYRIVRADEEEGHFRWLESLPENQ